MVNLKIIPKNRLTFYTVTSLNGYDSQKWRTKTFGYRPEILFLDG